MSTFAYEGQLELDEDDYFADDDGGWCGDCGDCEYCWDEQMADCGMQADGGCNLAGTEYCDWDCRMRELEDLYDEFEADRRQLTTDN